MVNTQKIVARLSHKKDKSKPGHEEDEQLTPQIHATKSKMVESPNRLCRAKACPSPSRPPPGSLPRGVSEPSEPVNVLPVINLPGPRRKVKGALPCTFIGATPLQAAATKARTPRETSSLQSEPLLVATTLSALQTTQEMNAVANCEEGLSEQAREKCDATAVARTSRSNKPQRQPANTTIIELGASLLSRGKAPIAADAGGASD
jgi:hypothetical protein